eukprot:Rhum_TRINITY_DN22897_c0_g1::Rhum_TRINITY_DN22897_c0_g1_i1::g.176106::m.176106
MEGYGDYHLYGSIQPAPGKPTIQGTDRHMRGLPWKRVPQDKAAFATPAPSEQKAQQPAEDEDEHPYEYGYGGGYAMFGALDKKVPQPYKAEPRHPAIAFRATPQEAPLLPEAGHSSDDDDDAVANGSFGYGAYSLYGAPAPRYGEEEVVLPTDITLPMEAALAAEEPPAGPEYPDI